VTLLTIYLSFISVKTTDANDGVAQTPGPAKALAQSKTAAAALSPTSLAQNPSFNEPDADESSTVQGSQLPGPARVDDNPMTIHPTSSTPVEPTSDSVPCDDESPVIGGEHATVSSPLDLTATLALPGIGGAPNAESESSPQVRAESTEERAGDDVLMRDATSGASAFQKPRNDEDLPPWLAPMIEYLRGLVEDAAWQDLVSDFVEFEKRRPANGVSPYVPSFFMEANYFIDQNLPTKSRPKEVTEWIRSKKKSVVPVITPGPYGHGFMQWWRLMQPSWRIDESSLVLIREVPKEETWQGLRKGGTSGIYVVVMGLSWWIKSQLTERDADAWTAVEDVSWVIQQMTEGRAPSAPPKRALEGESEGAAQPKKVYVHYFCL
jgi:hypothetical protein